MTIYCIDDRHGTPCPQPPNADRCEACDEDGCDSTQVVEADTPQDAARAAGWSEAYIAEQDWSVFDPDDEDGLPPDLNREGDPTLNGAFG